VSCSFRSRWLSAVAVMALLILTGRPSARGQAPSRARTQSAPGAEYVAITNVTVIDVARGVEERGWTVVTEGDRITRIGAAVPIPPGAARVDGSGKFLIPGLWDMHSHNQGTGMGLWTYFW
jgi:cytosine/adenosine deaminase-related metal-dependent hydrolase